jgi:hypothetical protein
MNNSSEIRATIRFKNRSTRTIEQVDRICREYGISRSAAITKVFEYLESVDQTPKSPLYQAPNFLKE